LNVSTEFNSVECARRHLSEEYEYLLVLIFKRDTPTNRDDAASVRAPLQDWCYEPIVNETGSLPNSQFVGYSEECSSEGTSQIAFFPRRETPRSGARAPVSSDTTDSSASKTARVLPARLFNISSSLRSDVTVIDAAINWWSCIAMRCEWRTASRVVDVSFV